VKQRHSASAVSSGIILSRLTGLVREAVVRGRLGLGVAGDAYTAALRIPNLLQNLLGEGVLSGSFIPVYSGIVDEDPEEAGRLAGAVASFLVLVAMPVVTVGVVFAEPITRALQFGRAPESTDLTVDLVRIMTPGIGVLVLSAWSLGVLNSHRQFFLAYAAPALWNLTQIAVVLAAGTGVIGRDIAVRVAWAVTVGAVLQFVVQLPAVHRANPYIRPNLSFGQDAFKDFVRRLGPVVVGRGSAQISAFVDLILAALLTVGALGALGAAQVLYLLPISVFAMSVAAAELPELSRQNDQQYIHSRLGDGLIRIAFFVTFTTIVYLIAGQRVIATVYTLVPGTTFDDDDLLVIALVLGAYSLGLIAVSTSRLVQNAFYAIGDTRTPARAAIYRFFWAAVVAVLVMFQLDQLFVYDGVITGLDRLLAPLDPLPQLVRENINAPSRLGAVGLGVGAAAGAWLELILLRRALMDEFGWKSLTAGRWRCLGIPAAGTTLSLLILMPVTQWAPPGLDLVLAVGPAGCVYVLLASRAGVPEAQNMVAKARTAVRR